MTDDVEPVPEGYATVTPSLTVRGCAEAIGFYERAFGAEELERRQEAAREEWSSGEG